MITPDFSNPQEIRMGSPYKVCDVALQGKWVPSLPSHAWQDIYAQDDKGRFLVLVAWDIDENNNPGFKIVVIDEKKKSTTTSERYSGCCESIQWASGGVTFTAFGYFKVNI